MKNGQKTGFPIEFLGFDATNRKLSMRSRTWNKSEGPDPSKTGFYKGFKSKFWKFSIFGPPLSFARNARNARNAKVGGMGPKAY